MEQPFQAKPFLKWAGGKTQLLEELTSRLPQTIRERGKTESYLEPFVGGGAFFFHLRRLFVMEEVHLFDINPDLILAYQVMQREPGELIAKLGVLEEDYLSRNHKGRRELYYAVRDRYNSQKEHIDYRSFNGEWIERASSLIFLNKTCFNGLFRQNQRGQFNVPHGRYKNPRICDAANLQDVSRALQGVHLHCGDFLSSKPYVRPGSLVYFDPPYRPLSRTSSFTSYSKADFTDNDQIRLARYFAELAAKGAYVLLSNSDPKVSDAHDDFFDQLYKDFVIERVLARRSINCDGKARGAITEILVRNYKV